MFDLFLSKTIPCGSLGQVQPLQGQELAFDGSLPAQDTLGFSEVVFGVAP